MDAPREPGGNHRHGRAVALLFHCNGSDLAEVYVPKRSPDRVDIEVGRRVRTFRLQKGLSQEKLGDQLGLTFQQVQKYEYGTNRIGAGRLQRIANILEIPVSDFFTSHKQGGVARAELFKLLDTAAALRLVRAYSRIREPKVQLAIMRLAESIAADNDRIAK
jgi:transcriptional regulator with XRE-family HTH domain